MSCESVKDRILLYLYDELDESERDALEEHTDSCQSCSAALDNERQFLRSLNEREVPSAALLAAFRGVEGTGRDPHPRRKPALDRYDNSPFFLPEDRRCPETPGDSPRFSVSVPLASRRRPSSR